MSSGPPGKGPAPGQPGTHGRLRCAVQPACLARFADHARPDALPTRPHGAGMALWRRRRSRAASPSPECRARKSRPRPGGCWSGCTWRSSQLSASVSSHHHGGRVLDRALARLPPAPEGLGGGGLGGRKATTTTHTHRAAVPPFPSFLGQLARPGTSASSATPTAAAPPSSSSGSAGCWSRCPCCCCARWSTRRQGGTCPGG